MLLTSNDMIYLAALIVLPLFDRVWFKKQLPQLKVNIGRVRFYVVTISILWSLGLLTMTLAASNFLSVPIETTTLSVDFRWQQILVIAIIIAFLFLGVLGVRSIQKSPETAYQVLSKSQHATSVMPKTNKEERVFRLVSLSAGIWEEYVYRGIVFGLLLYAFGFWPALVGSSVLFGWLHWYLGLSHVFKTALVGMFFATLYYHTGSLLLIMILHFVIDLVSGAQYSTAYQTMMRAMPKPEDLTKKSE